MCLQRILTALIIGLPFGQATAAEDIALLADWELHDSLGREWVQELLYYDVDLAKPVEPRQEFAMTDGDAKPLPVQILERRTNNAGKVSGVRLALITDLKPFQQRRFRLHAAAPKDPASDSAVIKDGQRWLLTTPKIGVALPSGEGKPEPGMPVSEVPAPILAVRGAAADWVGKGWFTGTRKVVAWKSELLASGPVFAWAQVTYDFGGGHRYAVDVRVPAGQPVVLVREERNLPEVTAYETDPAKGDAFHLALAPGLQPTHVYSKRGLGTSGYFVEPGPGFKGGYLTPAQMHYVPAACNIVGTWRDGERTPFIGLFPRFLSHWDRPHHTFVPLAWDKDLGLVARFFLNHGNREWALMAGEKKDMLTPRGQGGELIGGYFDALLLHNKWGETPLDKVKDWVLDWGEVRYQPGRNYAPAVAARGNMPYFAEQFLSGGHKWHDTYIHVHQTWSGDRLHPSGLNRGAWPAFQMTRN
jgi:hypothetical protein